jgi:hypothetical protein
MPKKHAYLLLFQNRGALDQGERRAEEEAGGEGGRDQELVAAAEQPRAEREGDQGRAARGKCSLSPFWTHCFQCGLVALKASRRQAEQDSMCAASMKSVEQIKDLLDQEPECKRVARLFGRTIWLEYN